MKKNIYVGLLVVFILAAGFIILKSLTDQKKERTTTYTLLERKGPLGQSNDWSNTKKVAEKLLNSIKNDPGDTKSMIALANLFLLEARVTANYPYYDMAALKYVNDVLAKDKNNFEALSLKSMVYLSQHHFAEALTMAKTASAINPYNAFIYGVLVDGYVEMGYYDSAVMAAEKMMSIRPDLRSYARAAYLREIHGDYPGAIEAMKLAIDAGMPGDESTEWARVQLGHLYENIGDRENAAIMYATSLSERPGYVQALAGKARLAVASKDYGRAISWYQQADSLVNDFSFKEEMIDVYQLAGDNEKSATIAKMVIDEMNKNAVAATDQSIGHYADKELAYAYLKMRNFDKALEHALAEYNRRPGNIDVNETLAWVYYHKGNYAKALPYIKTALKTNSKNPLLLSRAGLIFKKAGDHVSAKYYLQESLKNKVSIPGYLEQECVNALIELSAQAKV